LTKWRDMPPKTPMIQDQTRIAFFARNSNAGNTTNTNSSYGTVNQNTNANSNSDTDNNQQQVNQATNSSYGQGNSQSTSVLDNPPTSASGNGINWLTTPASETIQNSLSAFPSISSSLAENLLDQGSNLADKVSSDFNSLSNSNFALATGKFSTIRDINTQLQFGDGLSSTNIENLTAQKASIITSLNENLGSAFSNARMTNFEDYLSTTGSAGSTIFSFAENTVDIVNNPSPTTAVKGVAGFGAGMIAGDAIFTTGELAIASGAMIVAPEITIPVLAVLGGVESANATSQAIEIVSENLSHMEERANQWYQGLKN